MAELTEDRAIGAMEPVASIEDLLATEDLETVYVPLPAPYKGGVKIRALTMSEATHAATQATRTVIGMGGKKEQKQDVALMNKLYVCQSMVEPKVTPAQYAAMEQKNQLLLTTVLKAIQELNGFTDKAAKEVKEEVEQEFQG